MIPNIFKRGNTFTVTLPDSELKASAPIHCCNATSARLVVAMAQEIVALRVTVLKLSVRVEAAQTAKRRAEKISRSAERKLVAARGMLNFEHSRTAALGKDAA